MTKGRQIAYVARLPLTADERARLEMLAKSERRSRAEVLRQALREYAERRSIDGVV